jgi:hypothetical protein
MAIFDHLGQQLRRACDHFNSTIVGVGWIIADDHGNFLHASLLAGLGLGDLSKPFHLTL